MREVDMRSTIRALLLSALILLAAGSFLYQRGSQLNVGASKEETLWEQAPGDRWLYVGGLMMLISGSLAVAAVKVWMGTRREVRSSLR
jgi:hypothetical protein